MKGNSIKIERNGKHVLAFGITKLPHRKNYCLYRERGAMIDVLAYFTSESNAEEFHDIIEALHDVFKEITKKD